MEIEPTKQRAFEREFCALLLRFGARSGAHADALPEAVASQLQLSLQALHASSTDGSSLTPLDVLRIRANKFAASRLPPAVFRDPAQLARLRAEILTLARALLDGYARSLFPTREDPT